MKWCDVHRAVRLRPSGECRLCTLEEDAKETERLRKMRLPVVPRKRHNEWELGGSGAKKFSRMSLEWRGKIEASKRPRAVIDDHHGYPVNNREQWAKDEAFRAKVGVRGYKDELYDALPEKMRIFLATDAANVRTAYPPRVHLLRATVLFPLKEITDVLASVGWTLWTTHVTSRDGYRIMVGTAFNNAWPTPQRAARFAGARERVHQPLYDHFTAGIGHSTVQNNVQLFGQANVGTPEQLTNMTAPAALASKMTYKPVFLTTPMPPAMVRALQGEDEDDDD